MSCVVAAFGFYMGGSGRWGRKPVSAVFDLAVAAHNSIHANTIAVRKPIPKMNQTALLVINNRKSSNIRFYFEYDELIPG